MIPKFFISPPFGNYLDLPNFISIKGSFTLEPRTKPGLLYNILTTLRYDFKQNGWVNKIGLQNPGIDYAIKKYKERKDCIISVAILSSDEVPKLVKKIPSDMNLELNISCPNLDSNLDSPLDLHLFLNSQREWCILKVSPYIEMETVTYYYEQGFRQFHFSNTIPQYEISKNEISKNKQLINIGGLSGIKIKKLNSKLIHKARWLYGDKIIIIGGGGIQSQQEINHYKNFGADHFSVSTVFFNPFKAYALYKYIQEISN